MLLLSLRRMEEKISLVVLLLAHFFSVPSRCAQCNSTTTSVDTNFRVDGIIDSSAGLQVLVPQQSFQCDGLVTGIRVFVIRVGDQNVVASPLTLQIWRPTQNGSYVLHWSIEHPGTPLETSRLGNVISFRSQLGVPVMARDVLGVHIRGQQSVEESEPYFQLAYSNSDGDVSPPPVVYYLEGVDTPLCNFSICGVDVKNRTSILPLISANFASRSTAQISDAISLLSASQIHQQCSSTAFSVCPTQVFVHPTTTTTRPSAGTRATSTQHVTAQVVSPSLQLAPSPSFNLVGAAEPEDGTNQPRSLSTEVIVFITVGSVLFVILVVLVIVLIACVCSNRGSTVHDSMAAEIASIDSRTTANTHVFTSVEQSNSSSNVNSSTSPTTNGGRSNGFHVYANAEVTRENEGILSRGGSTRRSSRAHSVSVMLYNSRYQNQPPLPQRNMRAHSVSHLDPRHSYRNLRSLQQQQQRINQRSQIELSGDYTEPEAIPQPVATTRGPSNSNRLREVYNYYSIPGEPGTTHRAPNYDRLAPHETYDRLSAIVCETMDGYQYEPSHGSMETMEAASTTSLEDSYAIEGIYNYVPTEDQRRFLQLKNGGYEIEEHIQSQPVKGYDHLQFFKESEVYWAPAATTAQLYTQLSEYKYRELPRAQIRLLKQIGSGHFGTVSKGLWVPSGSESEEVAVKTVKNTTELERLKLLQEAAIMGQFAHPNVVRLSGVVTVGDPVLIVLEFMPRGDLRSFLQKLHPKVSKRELPNVLPLLFVKFSKDIASGMSYLSKKSFIHRDLAARNVLLTSDLTCKIGDFGMARDIESDYYKSRGGIVPVKWTAPEAINYNRYTSASDVWSFGMVLFEIWSLGQKPFHDLTNPIVVALVSSKHCQPPPPGCPRPIYHLMVECWNPNYAQRPSFDSIYDYLDSPEESLLQWQSGDIIPGKRAEMLGAPLLEANNLYFDLQRTYQKPTK